jgi:RNA polymerase sigma-70 factor (ECF subfamily)
MSHAPSMGELMGDVSQPLALPAALFAEILDRTQSALVVFARGLLGNSEDARDVVQDAYVAAWRQAERRAPPFSPTPDHKSVDRWLYAVTYNRAISLLRHRRVIAWESLDSETRGDIAGHATTLPFEDQVAEGAALSNALTTLGPEDAACLLLNLVQGYSAAEIAQTLDITPQAARKRIWRALQRLRAAYRIQNPPSAQASPPSARPPAEPWQDTTWKRADQ